MFCPECGKEIPNDSRFCPECGKPQEAMASVTKIRPQGQRVKRQPKPVTPEEAAKIAKRNKMIARAAGGFVGLCLIIGIASALIKPSINLNKYVEISCEGYDTVGNAAVSFDTEKFEKDYGKKLSPKGNKKKASSASLAANAFLSNCVDGHLDAESGLSNGDKITYKWNCDDKYALEQYGYKLKYEDIEYTVSDLKEAETFDPFEGMEVAFEGISPNGSASIFGEPKDAAAQEFRYEIDNKKELKNGDTITVKASMYYSDDPIEYCITHYGKIPSSLTKTFTVKGLDSYIRSMEDVSPEALEQMQNQASDVYYSGIAQNWEEGEELKSFTYLGSYLLTTKSSDGYRNTDNICYLVYRVDVEDSYSNESDSYDEINSIYWYIAYYNLLVNPKGVTTVDVMSYDTPRDRFTVDSGISSGWWSTKAWYYYGYQSLEELYKNVVTTKADAYNHEDNIDESAVTAIAVPAEIVGTTEAAETEEQAAEGEGSVEEGIIFPDSSESYLSEEDAKMLSDEELRYAINEIYARNGYVFKDEGLRKYYEKYDWYVKAVDAGNFSMDSFNPVEKANLEVLQKERDSR